MVPGTAGYGAPPPCPGDEPAQIRYHIPARKFL